MTIAERAGLAGASASDALAVQLFQRRYERTLGILSREFPHDVDDVHDAVIDALQEIRQAGRYTSYSRRAEYLWIDLARKRMLDRVRRRARRQQIATVVELDETRDEDGVDAVGVALEASSSNARLRELIAPMRPREAQFWFLRWHECLETAEICERMQISSVAARKLITSCSKRMRAFYEAVEDGSVHDEFEGLLRLRLAGDRSFDVSADPLLAAHLGWCEQCGRLLDQADRDLRAIVPLLPAIAAGAAKGGLLGALFGGSGGAAAGGGGGSLLGGLTAGKAVVVACSVGCVAVGGVAVVEVSKPAAPRTANRTLHAARQRSAPSASGTALVSGNVAAVAARRSTPRAAGMTSTTASSATERSKAREAKSTDVEQFAGLATAAGGAHATSATPPASTPAASGRQVENGYGLRSGRAASTSSPSSSTQASSASVKPVKGCTPGDLGC